MVDDNSSRTKKAHLMSCLGGLGLFNTKCRVRENTGQIGGYFVLMIVKTAI